MTTFEAIWPITAPKMATTGLFAEAAEDLPELAARHNVRLTGEPVFQVRSGKFFPGSNGAALVVHCLVAAEELGTKDYGQPHPLGAVA